MSIFNKNPRPQPIKMRTSITSSKPDRRISCKDLGQGDCEGWLWIKKCSLLSSKFVRRWCVLKSNCLFFYIHTANERAEGIIHLQDFKICPLENFKSKNFYFKICNQFVNFTLAIETQSGFMKWLNKLQLSASNVNLQSFEGQIAGFTPGYTKIEERTLNQIDQLSICTEGEPCGSLGYSESEDSDIESDKISCESQNEEKNCNHKIPMTSAEPVNSSLRTSEELSELTMNAIKRIVEIERLLREKKQLLAQIDNFLKYPLTSDRIQSFLEEYNEEISKL